MTDNDRQSFAEALIAMGESQKRKEPVSDAMAEFYFMALRDYPWGIVQAAMVDFCKQSPFFPAPAEVLEVIRGRGRKIEDAAFEEAAKVLDAVRRVGCYSSVEFDDQVTTAVIERNYGGWVQLGEQLNVAEVKWFLKDFRAAYEAFARSDIRLAGHLAGRSEISDCFGISSGREHKPVPIGVPERIEQLRIEAAETGLDITRSGFNCSAGAKAFRSGAPLHELLGSMVKKVAS